MSSRLLRNKALEKEDRIDEMKKQNTKTNSKKATKKKKKKKSPPIPHLLQAQQAPALPCAKVVGRSGSGSYPAPSPDPTTQFLWNPFDVNNNINARRKAEGNISIVGRIQKLRIECQPRHDKTNKRSVRPAKTQISQGIRPVWSESSVCA